MGEIPADAAGGVALYHLVTSTETFEDAAQALLQTVQLAAREHPGKPRHLYLDIEGHRNDAGGWDPDMYELQTEFIIGFLGQWLTSIPLMESGKRAVRDNQREDVPKQLTTLPTG